MVVVVVWKQYRGVVVETVLWLWYGCGNSTVVWLWKQYCGVVVEIVLWLWLNSILHALVAYGT